MKSTQTISLKKFMLAATATILILVCSIMKVSGKGIHQISVSPEAYRSMEKAYVEQVKEYLQEGGYARGGVTMTKVYGEDGMRAYDVTVHHQRMNKLSRTEQDMLLTELSEIAFPVEGCTFSYHLLITE